MITVRECQYDEVKKFWDLEGEYHYMGESHGAGDMIRLIFEEDGKFIREVVGLVSLVDAESGDVVAVAPVSKKERLGRERGGASRRHHQDRNGRLRCDGAFAPPH